MSTVVPKKHETIYITQFRQAYKSFVERDFVISGLTASYSGLTVNLTAGRVMLAGCYIDYPAGSISVPANSSGFIKCRINVNAQNLPTSADIIVESSSTDGEFKMKLYQYTSSSSITSLTDIRPKRIIARRELITASQSISKKSCLLYIFMVGGGGKGSNVGDYPGGQGGPVLDDYTQHTNGNITITVGAPSENNQGTVSSISTSFETLSTTPTIYGIYRSYGIVSDGSNVYSGTVNPSTVGSAYVDFPLPVISGYVATSSISGQYIYYRGNGVLGTEGGNGWTYKLAFIKSSWNYGMGGQGGQYTSTYGTAGAVLMYSWEFIY